MVTRGSIDEGVIAGILGSALPFSVPPMSNSFPLVTIGIPAYNSGPWIVPAIESALGQSWPNKEVLVLDDGSSDRTVQRLAAFGDRLRLLQARTGRSSLARQLLLEASSGEWVQWLDHDDYLLPEKIATQIAEAGSLAEADVLFSPFLLERWSNGSVQILRGASRSTIPRDLPADLASPRSFPKTAPSSGAGRSFWPWAAGRIFPSTITTTTRSTGGPSERAYASATPPPPGQSTGSATSRASPPPTSPKALRWRASMVREAAKELQAMDQWTRPRREAAQAEYARILRVLDRLAPQSVEPLSREARLSDLWSERALAEAAEPHVRWLVRLLGFRRACRVRRLVRSCGQAVRRARKGALDPRSTADGS
ncbi:glycosyltransferase family A protein [Verrucomicrobium sp. 3C]|uniref:glycosyltransferase family A protein n=1 Tax=Verrucomicrobium sp. 3C TaxID=1134055 RepID=UPI0003A3F6A9|nr:glycosyltransferase family A protein [Verrucomicrobium sp. 3C]